MYIIDSPQSTEDDQDEIGPFLSSRRVGERDITAVRIPTYSFDAIMLIGRGSIGALYVFPTKNGLKLAGIQVLWAPEERQVRI